MAFTTDSGGSETQATSTDLHVSRVSYKCTNVLINKYVCVCIYIVWHSP